MAFSCDDLKKMDDLIAKINEYKAMKDEIDALEETLEDELKEIIGECEEEIFTANGKCSWKTSVSSRFDGTAFKKACPDVYKTFLKASSSRRLLTR